MGHRDEILAALTGSPAPLSTDRLAQAIGVDSAALLLILRSMERGGALVSRRQGERLYWGRARAPRLTREAQARALLAGRPMTANELAEQMGVSRDVVDRQLEALADTGEAVRTNSVWRLALEELRA